jgi:predicted Zn-dependent peptidase
MSRDLPLLLEILADELKNPPSARYSGAGIMRGKANMNFVMGTASGLRRNDPDYEAALLGNAALGQNSLSSRIGKRVRDTEGLSSRRRTWPRR